MSIKSAPSVTKSCPTYRDGWIYVNYEPDQIETFKRRFTQPESEWKSRPQNSGKDWEIRPLNSGNGGNDSSFRSQNDWRSRPQFNQVSNSNWKPEFRGYEKNDRSTNQGFKNENPVVSNNEKSTNQGFKNEKSVGFRNENPVGFKNENPAGFNRSGMKTNFDRDDDDDFVSVPKSRSGFRGRGSDSRGERGKFRGRGRSSDTREDRSTTSTYNKFSYLRD